MDNINVKAGDHCIVKSDQSFCLLRSPSSTSTSSSFIETLPGSTIVQVTFVNDKVVGLKPLEFEPDNIQYTLFSVKHSDFRRHYKKLYSYNENTGG